MVPFGVNCCPIEAEEKIWHHTHRSEFEVFAWVSRSEQMIGW